MLEIEILKCEKGMCSFRIVQQSLRGTDFNPRDKGHLFKASNGYTLASAMFPAVNSFTLFVRGKRQEQDNNILRVEEKTFQVILNAIQEYNAIFNSQVKRTLHLPLK